MAKRRDPLASRIGECIHIERRRRDVTQEKLAEMVDVSPHHIGQIERGAEFPSMQLCYKIAQALGLKFNELLNITDL